MTTPRRILLALSLASGLPLAPITRAADTGETADRAYTILHKYCAECHARPADPVKGDLQVFNYKQLTWRRKVVRANKPDESELFQLVACGSMPPGDRAKPTAEEVGDLRQWIAAGAPPDYGESYVMKKIEQDLQALRSLHQNDPPGQRDPLPFQRYVSFNHLLAEDADPDPVLWRDALVQALNHLSWETKPADVTPIDPASTLFRFDERDLGWNGKPFEPADPPFGNVDLFDLVLLEYPYATLPSAFRGGEERILGDYLHRAGPARPILYVRGDWFVSTATRPPLYEDLLRLPRTPPQSEGQAARAGVLQSKMNQRPQLFERRDKTWPGPDGEARPGASWRTFDPGAATDLRGLLRAPDAGGGLMLFSLPNGFNGYYIAENVPDKGGKHLVRLAASAPSGWVRDPNAPDGVAHNGLSCMRCHEHGVEHFDDAARAAVEELPAGEKDPLRALFPGKDAMDKFLAADAARFQNAVKGAGLQQPDREPLTPVTTRFLQAAQAGPVAPAVLAAGAGVAATPVVGHKDPGMPDPARFPETEKTPLPPLDGLTLPDYPPLPPAPVDVEITAWNYKTEPHQQTNVFVPGDEFALEVKNNGAHEIYFELIAAVMDGRTFIRQPQRTLAAKTTYKYPEERPKVGEAPPKKSFTMGLPPGVDRYILFASDVPFPEAVLLKSKDAGVADRVVHKFWTTSADGSESRPAFDLSHLVKKTLEVTTVEKR